MQLWTFQLRILKFFIFHLVCIIYSNINTSTLVYTLKYISIEGMNSMGCFMIGYIQLSAQYTECQQERNLISTLLLNSGQIKGGLLLHFSASELKQTLFPEDSMLWNLLPDIWVNSSWKLGSTLLSNRKKDTPKCTIWKHLSHWPAASTLCCFAGHYSDHQHFLQNVTLLWWR